MVQRTIVGERSVNMVNHFLELTAREIKTIVGVLCERRVALQQQVCVCDFLKLGMCVQPAYGYVWVCTWSLEIVF